MSTSHLQRDDITWDEVWSCPSVSLFASSYIQYYSLTSVCSPAPRRRRQLWFTDKRRAHRNTSHCCEVIMTSHVLSIHIVLSFVCLKVFKATVGKSERT